MRHELCTCGHCRCEHTDGSEGCRLCGDCIRYTWPGRGNELPTRHRRRRRYNVWQPKSQTSRG